MAPPEKTLQGGSEMTSSFKTLLEIQTKQVNYVFQQLILCLEADLFTRFLCKYSVLHWIIFIGKKYLNYIYDSHSGKSQYVVIH